ncbi:MAG: DNA circularization N-terminal domain-containing protein, partial [Pseudomonadota bacterium]
MSARDWIASLRPASYRGAPFFVDTDNWKTGRRLITHEFPLNDRPYIEDLGRSANTFSVTAYVASDEADSQAVALLRACDRGGVATLSLPLMRVQAHCQSASRQHSKDQLGYIAISM